MLVNPEKTAEFLTGQITKQQNGIDLHVVQIERVTGHARIGVEKNDFANVRYAPVDISSDGWWRLEQDHMYRVTFDAYVKVPENMAAILIHRSSMARSGCFIFSGLYDSGFEGQAGAFLHADNTVVIQKGARLAQILFFDAESRELYNGQYQRT